MKLKYKIKIWNRPLEIEDKVNLTLFTNKIKLNALGA